MAHKAYVKLLGICRVLRSTLQQGPLPRLDSHCQHPTQQRDFRPELEVPLPLPFQLHIAESTAAEYWCQTPLGSLIEV